MSNQVLAQFADNIITNYAMFSNQLDKMKVTLVKTMGQSIIDNIQHNINLVQMNQTMSNGEKSMLIAEYERQKIFFQCQIHYIIRNINETEILKTNSETNKMILLSAYKEVTSVEQPAAMEPKVAAFMNAVVEQKPPAVEEAPPVEQPPASSSSFNFEEMLKAMQKVLNKE